MEKEFLSIKETAELFSVHINTIYTWIEKGFIVANRIGNKPKSPYRISRRSIDKIHESIIKKMSEKAPKT